MSNKLDFTQLVDMLAHEYGWTVEYIQSLDNKEIRKFVEAIHNRKKNEFKIWCYIINCAFNGKQPKFEKEKEVSEDEGLAELIRLGIAKAKEK